MCGIAGFVGRSEFAGEAAAAAGAVLESMCRIIAHRGPDEQGATVRGAAALGMRRLSIIDLAGGQQPMSGCDTSVTIVFNGEIYNYRELRRDLEARGHRFHTNSDTEAIVHAYEEHGARCVEHLRGMFGFAVWDERRRRLFVARDRAGKKPLYYTLTPEGTLVFGSELKSLLLHPEVRREVSPEAVDSYLSFGYVPDPLSIFRSVHKLPPGCHLTFEGGRVEVEEYWDFPFKPEEVRAEDDWLEELRALLDESVRVRLVADVPLGAFLSGGVDSSAVVGLMARASERPVKTFSIGFREDSYDELKYARVAAERFKTEHHEFIVTPDVCALVDELVWHFDEPFADSSALPTYMVSKLARDYVKVVLSGDGGDELFAGYTRYAVDRRRGGFARLPRVVREGLMQPLGRRLPHGARGRNFIHNVALDPVDRYVEEVSVFTRLNKASLYTEEFRRRLGASDPAASFRATAGRAGTGDPLDALLYLDAKTYLPGDILTKVDRMTMAVGLEARAPLLDHKLIEFVGRIPARFKMKGLETKHLFKRAVEGLVPDEILRRPKQGFGVPIQHWINSELRGRTRETLLDARATARGYTDTGYVRLLLDEHERGRRDHAAELWSLFVLELWHRNFVDQAPRPERPEPAAHALAVA
ncbi:MAG: asparagine synthase (glutamine-hydrolyzing) [Acidobacteria bacterium]|nr:asparagine synthase (glutamine-hydrolyzing) [Acidobacteriota bacterium]